MIVLEKSKSAVMFDGLPQKWNGFTRLWDGRSYLPGLSFMCKSATVKLLSLSVSFQSPYFSLQSSNFNSHLRFLEAVFSLSGLKVNNCICWISNLWNFSFSQSWKWDCHNLKVSPTTVKELTLCSSSTANLLQIRACYSLDSTQTFKRSWFK